MPITYKKFLVYVRTGQVDEIRNILESKIQFDGMDHCISFALHKSTSIEITTLLIEHGADVNYRGRNFATPLCSAVERNSFEMVKFLIERGAKINYRGRNFGTPLCSAVEQNSFEMVKFLIENGAEVNAEDINELLESLWSVPLIVALSDTEVSLEILRYLIDKGANVNAMIYSKYKPLHFAIDSKDLNKVMCLVRAGATFCCVTCFVTCNDYKPEIKKFLENYRLVKICFDLWNMDSEEYSLFIQWLPEEMINDMFSLIVEDFCDMRSFLYDY